MLNVKEQSI